MLSTALVLFDLDGTLADTAPDLAAAANRLRNDRGLPPLPLAQLRPYASQGARGLIGAALSVTPGTAEYEPLRLRFLDYYARALDVHTRLFDGVADLLTTLEARRLPWGIVTNKAAHFTAPVVAALELTGRAAVIVSGDTTPHAKPHPAPLLHAAAVCGVAATAAIYVGDDRRDIEAGRAAGMATVVATYGYLADGDWTGWGANHSIDHPADLLGLLT